MKNQILRISIIAISISVLIWSGCDNNKNPDTEEYIIQIDSLIHPDTINFGEDLSIKLYGVVGSDGCYEVDRLEPEYIDRTLSITTYGIHTLNEVCTQAVVYMNGHELLVSDVPAGDITIEAIQPDGSKLTQTVFVKE